MRTPRCVLRGVLAGLVLAVPAQAAAHAVVSPPVTVKGRLQVFTIAVPTEKNNLFTTRIQVSVPNGFGIDSFEDVPGWTRTVAYSGSGSAAQISSVTYSGGRTPTSSDAMFRLLAEPADATTYTFSVKQTYSDGSVVFWNGPESSDSPAPTVDVVSSLDGGGGSNTLVIIALVVSAVAVLISVVTLVSRGGGSGPKRSMT